MKSQKHKILRFEIEFWGWAGLLFFILSIGADGFRWKLFFSGIISWLICLGSYASLKEKEKNEN